MLGGKKLGVDVFKATIYLSIVEGKSNSGLRAFPR